jgi:hypothetical protein
MQRNPVPFNPGIPVPAGGGAVVRERAWFRGFIALTVLFAASLILSSLSGALQSEFGRHQDEGMHYVTGLLVQDFATSGQWRSPMSFAQQYYLHFPKVALGQWPPGFSLLQAAWGLLFGVSRVSMLVGMNVLTAWLAFLVYRAGARYFGAVWGALGALLLIAAPLTQESTAMVMAEVPLAAASFLAIAAFVRFLESARTRDAVMFGLWSSAAIMIKGNGWVICLAAPLILLCTGKFRLLLDKGLWIAALLIGVLCVPFTAFTMRIVAQGMDTRTFPGFAYEWASLGKHLGFVIGLLGIPLTIIAVIGASASLFRRSSDLFWKSLTIYGLAIVIFHVAVPSSIEPRKLYQIVPVMCLLVLRGLQVLITRSLLERPVVSQTARLVAAGAVGLLFMLTGFLLLPRYTPGFGPAVASLIGRAETPGAAVLISSNPELADSEAALIAEWASRERNRGTYLIRATKLLSHPPTVADQTDYVLNFSDRASVLQALSSIPVSFVILDTATARAVYPHHELLRAALAGDSAEWERVYHTERNLPGLRESHEIEIYRYRRNVAGASIHYSVDLTRKLGADVRPTTDDSRKTP